MPRIRTIKPEFWQDEKLAGLDPLTRLVFVGLISMADDAGRIVDNVKSIDGFIFPETEDTAHESLDTLARLSRILRYIAPNGQKLIQVVRWSDHQKVDHPNKHILPAPSAEDLAAARDARHPVGSRESVAMSSRGSLATTSTPTSTGTSDLKASGPDGPGAPSRKAEPPVSKTRGNPDFAVIAGAVRKHWWAPDELPPDGWHMDRELDIWRDILDSGVLVKTCLQAIEGMTHLREAGGTYDCAEPEAITWLRKHDKITARVFNNTHAGARDLLPLAIEAYHRGPPGKRPVRADHPTAHGPERLSTLMRGEAASGARR